MNKKTKVSVQGVPETMLQTLYARAKESKKKDHHIYDEKAIDIVASLDYDFSKADTDTAMSSGVVARTIILDKLAGEFLNKNKNAIVVNIACGLDTRCYRMKGRYSRWYNIDLPETMHVREMFMEENGPVYQIAKSAMDSSYVEDIEYNGEPVLVIIEGLTMYLNEDDVKQMFDIIHENFATAHVLVETMSPLMAKHIKEKSIEGSSAKFTWGVKNGKALQDVIAGFRNIEDVSLVEGMKVMIPIYKIIGNIPAVKNISNKICIMDKR